MFGASNFESLSDTSSDCEDDLSIYSGHAQSILSSLDDSIGNIDYLLTYERRFIPGDVVSLAREPSGQLGKILGVDAFVDLENVLGQTFKDINTKNIQHVRDISVGDHVICGPWLGRVTKVVESFIILLDDGSKCEVTETGQSKLLPVSPNLLDDSLYRYHPGQRVKVRRPSVSMSSGWLCGTSKRNDLEGTIYSVNVGSVSIEWLACVLVGHARGISPPSSLQDPKNLTLLSCFRHANWQVGDWCILQSAQATVDNDGICTNNIKGRVCNSKLLEMFAITKKRTKVDVMWQDGSYSFGLGSNSLLPTNILNAYDFFPQQYVLDKARYEDAEVRTGQSWGSVQSVDANERTVKVRWRFIGSSSGDSDEWMEETVSAYELVEHPDFSFSLGDIVFSLKGDQSVNQPDYLSTDDFSTIRSEENPADADDTWNKCFLSYIGHVIGFENGNVEVQWANGITSKVRPNEIFHVEKDDSTLATHGLDEGNAADLATEVINDEKEYWHLITKEQDVPIKDMISESPRGHTGNPNFFDFPKAALGFFSGIVASFFGTNGSPQQILQAPEADECETASLKGLEVLENGDMISDDKLVEMPRKSCVVSSNTKMSEHFKQFDIISDCSDHHFANGVGHGSPLSQINKGWSKKVQQEWKILEQNLPDTIYVRIYEERMDLLRAAIVGAVGTPYHDGLFFFDVFLPPEYPHEPPLVHYHSGGLRLNPNLYESGRVCLSLLNTWTGTGSEAWNSGSSTILQVLVSLQALVLNEKPYFNEAGYDEQLGRVEGEKNSVSYNENAFLVTCKSMLYLLRNPPKHFEGLVQEHFKTRARPILFACKAYMADAPIGSVLPYCATAKQGRRNSTGFKIMLAKLLPKLVEAFSVIGIDCSQYSDV